MHLSILSVVTLMLCCFNGVCSDLAQAISPDEQLQVSADWQPPTRVSIIASFEKWMAQTKIPADRGTLVTDFIESHLTNDSTEVLDTVFDALEMARPDLAEVRQRLKEQRTNNQAPEISHWIDNPNEAPFLRDNVRLYLARWLAQNEFYDEARNHLQQLDLTTISDPMTLLFYRGLMDHQLLNQAACVNSIEQLLQHEDRLPRRFAVLSKLMLADIQSLETDSLDEIARLMGDIRRRTTLHRSGTIVRDQEQSVIDKLDKLIDGLEAQQAQAQPGGGQSSTPMQDSQRAGGQGSGDVTQTKQSAGGDWGNLPPAQRAAALAEMAKSMPPHYRDVIEEYFRQLADEDQK